MDDCNCSVKKSPYMKEWMAQLILEKKPIRLKMNGRLLLLSSNKTAHYFKEWRTAGGVLKKIYCLYKNLMLQIYPTSSSCSQKLYALNTSKEQIFGESRKSPLQAQIFAIALLKHLLYWIWYLLMISIYDISLL